MIKVQDIEEIGNIIATYKQGLRSLNSDIMKGLLSTAKGTVKLEIEFFIKNYNDKIDKKIKALKSEGLATEGYKKLEGNELKKSIDKRLDKISSIEDALKEVAINGNF